jgi:hypothetical protein
MHFFILERNIVYIFIKTKNLKKVRIILVILHSSFFDSILKIVF